MRPGAPAAWYHGPLGRGLMVVWALALALVAAPCAAMADGGTACGHCAVDASHAADGTGHGGDCFQCDTDVMAAPQADDRGPAAAAVAAPAAPVVVAARPAPQALRPALPRPPDLRLYLKTRRLRI